MKKILAALTITAAVGAAAMSAITPASAQNYRYDPEAGQRYDTYQIEPQGYYEQTPRSYGAPDTTLPAQPNADSQYDGNAPPPYTDYGTYGPHLDIDGTCYWDNIQGRLCRD